MEKLEKWIKDLLSDSVKEWNDPFLKQFGKMDALFFFVNMGKAALYDKKTKKELVKEFLSCIGGTLSTKAVKVLLAESIEKGLKASSKLIEHLILKQHPIAGAIFLGINFLIGKLVGMIVDKIADLICKWLFKEHEE